MCEKREREHARAIVNTSSQNGDVMWRVTERSSITLLFLPKTSLATSSEGGTKIKTHDHKIRHLREPVASAGVDASHYPRWSSLGSGTSTACSLSVSVSFRSRFRTLTHDNPDGKVVTPSFKAIFGEKRAFPASVVPPAAARFAGKKAPKRMTSAMSALRSFVVGARVVFSLFVALLKGVYK